MFTVTNNEGNDFNVVVVLENDSYGLDDCLTHNSKDPLIEFYDAEYVNKHGFGVKGQFISRYSLSILSEHTNGYGLNLEGSIPKWTISELNLKESLIYVNEYIRDQNNVRG